MPSPQRIVSLVPSLTELVWWLGAGDRLVGRTRFCLEPPSLAGHVPALGGTKTPRVDAIIALEPDLVVANREENRREDVEAMQAAGLNVLLTDPCSVREAIVMTRELGALLECEQRAGDLAAETGQELDLAATSGPDVFVAIWPKPLMGLGGATYGHDIVEAAGGRNVLAARDRYPEVTLAHVRALRPGLVLLPDEPYRFDETHAAAFSTVAPAQVVDGKLLWWYGPRMPAALRTLRALFSEAAHMPGGRGRP